MYTNLNQTKAAFTLRMCLFYFNTPCYQEYPLFPEESMHPSTMVSQGQPVRPNARFVPVMISFSLALSSSTSQLLQTNLPFKKPASGLESQRMK